MKLPLPLLSIVTKHIAITHFGGCIDLCIHYIIANGFIADYYGRIEIYIIQYTVKVLQVVLLANYIHHQSDKT